MQNHNEPEPKPSDAEPEQGTEEGERVIEVWHLDGDEITTILVTE